MARSTKGNQPTSMFRFAKVTSKETAGTFAVCATTDKAKFLAEVAEKNLGAVELATMGDDETGKTLYGVSSHRNARLGNMPSQRAYNNIMAASFAALPILTKLGFSQEDIQQGVADWQEALTSRESATNRDGAFTFTLNDAKTEMIVKVDLTQLPQRKGKGEKLNGGRWNNGGYQLVCNWTGEEYILSGGLTAVDILEQRKKDAEAAAKKLAEANGTEDNELLGMLADDDDDDNDDNDDDGNLS